MNGPSGEMRWRDQREIYEKKAGGVVIDAYKEEYRERT